MRQVRTYKVTQQGFRNANMLDGNDALLVNTYALGISSFNPDESRLDVVVRDENGNVLETFQNIPDYKILGVEQGPHKVNQLVVDPTLYLQDRTYLGNIVVEYQAFNNLYSRGAELFVFEISADRTEVRAKSLVISNSDLRYFTQALQNRLNNESYFSEAYLEVQDQKFAIINATTEVVNNALVATFKLYKPLPEFVELRTPFRVLESLGESNQFLVQEEITVVEDPPIEIKGPNFGVKLHTATHSTPYRNYLELLSQKSWECSKELYSSFKRASQHVSVDYSDFSQFVHFSSAFERLENARYKFELILDYKHGIEIATSDGEKKKLQDLIDGIIENFDHYENFLYFENDPAAWPKKEENGEVIRPYEIEDDVQTYEAWYEEIIAKAEAYDLHNKDLLINTIPVAIREDVDNNEPYIMFIHMIGQHFDDLWIYARAITDRYKADNRANFGISKELVKDAIENFGLDLYETDQNLNALFELIRPDGTYDTGLETAVKEVLYPSGSYIVEDGTFTSGSWAKVPRIETYTKEVYKRIYHNIPALVKMKGTSRGLRVLLNCFGIPNSILKFRVQGGTDPEHKPFFGPEEWVSLSETGSFYDLNKIDSKVRHTGSVAVPFEEYQVVDGTGSFYTSSVLSQYASTTASVVRLTDDSHKVEVGFDLNEAVDNYFAHNVPDGFTVDDVIGDPRNKEENYGDVWKHLREQLVADLGDSKFRSPAALIRLVRYFDTAFFRMLQDFIPARASIDSAVIVKDNILHRNRWKGVDLDLKELSLSGSTSGSTAYGSHGGAFEYAGKRFDTGTGSYYVADPNRGWVQKPVLSGSREFTGELAGTEFSTLTGNGDLSQYNTHRKNSQPSNRFNYAVWFLDLPDPPLCSVNVAHDEELGLYSIKSVGGASTVAAGDNVIQVAAESSKFLGGTYTQGQVETSQWGPLSASLVDRLFVGTALSSSTWNGKVTAESSVDPSRTFSFESADYEAKRVFLLYESTENKEPYTLWTELVKPEGSDYYSYDILLSWKYIPQGVDPQDNQQEYRKPWTSTDPIDVVVTLTDGTTKTISVSSMDAFGANEGYYWVRDQVGQDQRVDLTKQYGVQSLYGRHCPFTVPGSTYFVDATWYENYEDWFEYLNNHRWAVVTSSAYPNEETDHHVF